MKVFTPWRASLSGTVSALSVPTPSVSAARPADGTHSAKVPLPSTNARVRVALSITTVTLGGEKSSAQAQAADITLTSPAWAEDTSTVGPWLMRR